LNNGETLYPLFKIIYVVSELWIFGDLLMVAYRKRPELLFGCIAATLMITYKYNVRGKTILGYRPKEARKE
jgi:hypothetical protein